MLFADDQAVAAGNYFAGMMMIVTAFITYLSGRDRLKFSNRTQEMEVELKQLRKDHGDCEAAHKDTLSKLVTVSEKCEKAERLASKMEGELAGANRELVSLRADVNQLRELLYHRTGGAS